MRRSTLTYISQRALAKLIAQQGYRCALSGRELTIETASLDHRMPMARGGSDAVENVWIVHAEVNRAKGTLTVEEFERMCRDVVRHRRRAAPRPAPPEPTLFDAAEGDDGGTGG